MTWMAPVVERPSESLVCDEWTALRDRLENNRATLLHKCAGLTAEQLAMRSTPPSTMSLLGLIRHMSNVERRWFRRGVLGEDAPPVYGERGERDVDFDGAAPEHAERDFAVLVEQMDFSREVVAGRSPDDTFTDVKWGEVSVRFLLGHMIEEYARHCGHADLLRERVDGVTGY